MRCKKHKSCARYVFCRLKNPKYKAYQKAYKKTDKYKAYQKAYWKAYMKTDKYKAYKKAYYQKQKALSKKRFLEARV